jgi:hypothetical protein
MAGRTAATDVSRRDALAVGAVVAGATFGLSGSRRAESQTPKRGGVFLESHPRQAREDDGHDPRRLAGQIG